MFYVYYSHRVGKHISFKCRTHLFYFSPHWKKRCTRFANILSSWRTQAARSRFEIERRRAARVTAARVPCYSLALPTAERSRAVAQMAEFHRSYDQRRERRQSRKNSFSRNRVFSGYSERMFVSYFLYYSFQGTLFFQASLLFYHNFHKKKPCNSVTLNPYHTTVLKF